MQILRGRIMEQVGTKPRTIPQQFGRNSSIKGLQIAAWLKSHLMLLLAFCYLVGAVWPAPGLWMRRPLWTSGPSPVVVLMAALLFTLGCKTRFVVKSLGAWIPRLDVFLLSRLGCIALVVVIAQAGLLPDAVSTGLVIILCMPSAGSSAAWCLRLGGNSTVCASLIMTTTLGWFFLLPTVSSLGTFLPEVVANPVSLLAGGNSQSWAVWGGLPLLLGGAVGWFNSRTRSIARRGHVIQLPATIGLAAVLLLNYANASSAGKMLWSVDGLLAALAAAFVACVLAALSRVVAASLVTDETNQCSAILTTSMSNTGLAMAFLLQTDAPAVVSLMLPAFTFAQHAAASRMTPGVDRTVR